MHSALVLVAGFAAGGLGEDFVPIFVALVGGSFFFVQAKLVESRHAHSTAIPEVFFISRRRYRGREAGASVRRLSCALGVSRHALSLN